MSLFNKIKSDKKFIIAVLILILGNLFIYRTILYDSSDILTAFKDEFPSKISDWTAEEVEYDPTVIASLDPDKTIYKTYYSEGKSPVTLFIAGYNSLEKADLSHSPIVCFTGQGWDIKETAEKEISIGFPENITVKVNQMIQNKAGAVMVTFYWYQSKDYAFSNRGKQKIYLLFQKLLGKSEGNAFVRLTIIVDRGESLEKSITTLSDFLDVFYPELRRYYN